MKDARSIGTMWIVAGAGLLCLMAAPGCVPKVSRRQTDIMEKTGAVKVSAAELRAMVNDLADRLVGRLELTSDRIRTETQDPAVRRLALGFKVEAIPAVYAAAYHADPLTGAIDLWGLAFQLSTYVDDGAGAKAFGQEQALARAASRGLLADTDAVLQRVAVGPQAFAKARGNVERWAREHPIEYRLSSRASVAQHMVELRDENRDAFVAVGAVSDTMENLSERLNTFAAQLPKQARWQAEILIADMAGERGMSGALGDVHDVGSAARRVEDLLRKVPGVLSAAGPQAHEALAAERRALLAGVDSQRVQTLEFATAERLALLAAVREERIALAAAFRQERIETLVELDAIKSRGVASAVDGLKDVVDYALWRVTGALLLLMLAATALAVLGYRFTLGRHRSAGASLH